MRLTQALLGALLITGGIAARIEAAANRPVVTGGPTDYLMTHTYHLGWSKTAYDLTRIGGWALVVFGVVIVAFALVREFRRPV